MIIGIAFTSYTINYYTEIGRLNTNLTIIAAGCILISAILLVTTILLYSLISVVRENSNK
jgi:hypothetical protein